MTSRDDARALYVGGNALVAIGAAACVLSESASAPAAAGVSIALAGLIVSMIAFASLARSGALDPVPETRRTRRTVGLALAAAAFIPAALGVALPAAVAVNLLAVGARVVSALI